MVTKIEIHETDPCGSPNQSEFPHACFCLYCLGVPVHFPHLLGLHLPEISETVWNLLKFD